MGEIMNNIGYEIERLLKFALKKNMISKWDVIPTRNALIDLLKLESPFEGEVEEVSEETPVKILNNILDYAVEAGLIEENTTTYRDLFDARIMGLLMPRESEIVKEFYNKYENESKEKATSWFYDLSKSSNYIMTQRIAKNLWWPVQTEYGDLEITINLSKPEKDPKEIAKAKLMKQLTYPKCLLCKENVGYAGRINHPARQNHRIIPMTLGNKDWFLQYSPYVYYNEHCIVFSGEHEPMKLTKNSIERLVEFTEVLPHYFIGSNADLPIVGGSILTHDHYQGGRHEFPMEKAKVEKYYESSKYKNLEIGIVKWPMSVVRIKGKNKNEVINATMDMFEAWKKYSDEEISYMFMHELSHYKGFDLYLNFLLKIINAIHWFNPFCYIFFKRIRQDIELKADSIAIKNLKVEDNKNYALTIIKVLANRNYKSYETEVLNLIGIQDDNQRRIYMIKFAPKFKEKVIRLSFLSISLISSLLIIFFIGKYTKIENDPFDFNYEDMVPYKVEYIGDFNKVKTLVKKLSLGRYVKYMEIPRTEDIKGRNIKIEYFTYGNKETEPVFYEFLELPTERKEEILKKNAITILSLVENSNSVKFIIKESPNYDAKTNIEKEFTREELKEAIHEN